MIEKTLQELKQFVTKYKDANDSNLKELDSNIKKMEGKFANFRPSEAKAAVKQETLAPKQSESDVKDPLGSDLNPRDFAVEKIFSNSNGKMMGK